MTKPVPINSLNAIEAMAFVVILSRELTLEEDRKLSSLEEELKTDLATFSQNKKFEAKFDGKSFEQKEEVAGVTLQDLDNNKKPIWALSINGNQIVVNCFAYDSWSKVWPKAKRFIQASLGHISSEDLGISILSLQCIDKFTQQTSSKEYTPFDIFKSGNKYLTEKSCTVGRLWHVHQGWFDEKLEGDRILNILNIGTIEKDANLITTVDHISQYFFKDQKGLADFTELDTNFNALHDGNKDLIMSLLNKDQLTAVGLV